MTPVPAHDLVLRPAVAADAPCISALAGQVFLDTYATHGITPWFVRELDEHLGTAAIAALLARHDTRFVLAELAGRLIGFAQSTLATTHSLVSAPAARAVELDRLYVQRPFFGRAVGTALLRRAEADALANGASNLWLTAWVGNDRARRFYAARGYIDRGATTYVFDGESFENRLFAIALSPSSENAA
jgi:ribosomal protein S18 acetylase RimI-like enzyme